MATLREIRRRIGVVKSTQKITKAMKMVAASKLRRAQEAVLAARPYAKTIQKLVSNLSETSIVNENILFQKREIKSVAVIVITSDRGLCGAFNSNVIKGTVAYIEENFKVLHKAGKVDLVCLGKKGYDFFRKNKYNITYKYTGLLQDLKFDDAKSIITEIVRKFTNGEYDRVDLIYNEFKSIIHQRVIIETIFPLSRENLLVKKPTIKSISHDNIIYEPSRELILSALLPRYINFKFWHAILESKTAEQAARMTAMENATFNAAELIETLQLSYNKARQASITKELLEIVSGAESLRSA